MGYIIQIFCMKYNFWWGSVGL